MAVRLEDSISYNPVTGHFHWIVAKPKIKRGSRAGGLTEKGYRKIKIDGKKYFEHRLAFYFMTGEWPKDQVDHKNNRRDDNRWGNLREANNAQQQYNARAYSSTGHKGVYKVRNKYRVKGHLDKHLGYTDDLEKAIMMSNEHRLLHQGEFYVGG